MPTSEAQKKARDKYDRENMERITIKVKKDLAKRFKEVAQERGDKVNTLFREYMEEYIKE